MCSWDSDTTYELRVIKLDSNTNYGRPCSTDSDSRSTCISAQIPKDSHFKFYIECFNEFGNVTTTSTRIGKIFFDLTLHQIYIFISMN